MVISRGRNVEFAAQSDEKRDDENRNGKKFLEFSDLCDSGIIGQQALAYTKSMGFVRTTKVQEIVIPLFMKQDVAVEACTGSGKTISFLFPIVEILMRKSLNRRGDINVAEGLCCVGGLILAPTRELVMQIDEVLKRYLEFVNQCGASDKKERLIDSLILTGGSDIKRDVTAIHLSGESAEHSVVVATPGRLSHLLDTLKVNVDWTFRELEVLVLDEADRLLVDFASFELQLSRILSLLPKQRRTGLFSATLSSEMKGIIKAGMRDPVIIRVAGTQVAELLCHGEGDSHSGEAAEAEKDEGSNEDVEIVPKPPIPRGLLNYVAVLHRKDKFAFLLKFLLTEVFPSPAYTGGTGMKQGRKCILFFLTCNCVNLFSKLLTEIQSQSLCPCFTQDVTIERLFGKMQQKARSASYKRFLSAPANQGALLIATDVAARGLDFPDVEWIVQFDAPLDPEMYVHRVGRTARAGRPGDSLLLISPSEEACLPFFQNRQVTLLPISEHPSLLKRIGTVNLTKLLILPSIENRDDLLNERPAETTVAEGIDTICVPYEDFTRAWELFRCLLSSDRDVLLKAAAAFVSFIRAYKEHQLQFIFPFKDLEIGEFATSLALLQIPRIREILGKSIKGFTQSSLAREDVPFKNPSRAAEFEQVKERRRIEQEQKKLIVKKKSNVTVKRARSKTEKKRALRKRLYEEWGDLAFEEKLFKKLRQGKISEEEYENRLARAEKGNGSNHRGGLDSTIDDDMGNNISEKAIHSDGSLSDNHNSNSRRPGDGMDSGRLHVGKWARCRQGGRKKR